MATTLEMLIRARYSSIGGEEANAQLVKINKSLERLIAVSQKTSKLKVLPDVPDESELQKFNPDEFLFSDQDASALRTRLSSMQSNIENFNEKAINAYVSGNDKAAKQFRETASGIETQKRSLEKLLPVVEETGLTIESLLTNKLTRLGFGIFALQSTIQTFTTLIKGMFDTIADGAGSLDRSRSFEMLLSGEGIDPSEMTRKLQVASQGLLTLDQSMAKTIQLAKAGFPEIAENSDALLKIATNAAIVSGDVGQAATVYDKLIRGIIRGSPRLIDDADIILKLGDANEKYAASLGKTVEELTAAEKVQATYNAVIQEGDRINQLADDMDSASVKVQQLSTEWSEFTEILKESVAITLLAGEGAGDVADSVALAVGSFTELDLEGRTALVLQLVSSLRGWGVILGNVFALVVEGIRTVVGQIALAGRVISASLEVASMSIQATATGLMYVRATMMGATDEAERLKKKTFELAGAINTLNNSFANTDDQGWSGFLNRTTDRFDEILEAAGFIEGKVRTGVSPTSATGAEDTAAVSAKEESENLGKILQERSRMSQDIAFERTQKIQEINRDHVDKMRDISRKLRDALSDIDRDLSQKLQDLAQTRADKLTDINQDLAEKMLDINQDLADKLSDITQDASDSRVEAQEDYHQGLQDAEEDHQKKLDDIMRKFESSRLKALIDRDARALFEAEQARKEDLEDAADTAEEKREEELEQLQEKLEDIAKKEAEQRQDAIKAAEDRRNDAQQAAERQRRDAQQAYDRARRDAQQDADRRRRDARENAARERREAQEDQAKARADLRSWYQERLRDLANFQADELGQINGHYASINQSTSSFMDSQLSAWSSFRGNRIWIGDGTTIDPGTGEEFPDWRDPSNVYVGGRCNRGSSQITTGADGRQYVCIGNSWTLFSGVGATAAGASGGGSVSSAGGLAPAGGGVLGTGTQQLELVLKGDGDDALTQIIESGAYKAIIQVVG